MASLYRKHTSLSISVRSLVTASITKSSYKRGRSLISASPVQLPFLSYSVVSNVGSATFGTSLCKATSLANHSLSKYFSTTTSTNASSSSSSLSSQYPASQIITLPQPFITGLGAEIPNVKIKVEYHGDPTLPLSRTILIFPSFSHSSHVASNFDDPSPGWWQEMVGAGKAIDTRHFRIICLSVLGSPFSPTNPTSINPHTNKPWRTHFPQLSPTDLARCHRAVLEVLGLTHSPVHAIIGSSLGGMQALQYGSLYPLSTAKIIAIAATGRTTPFTVAIRRMQRRAILSDPQYFRGDYDDHRNGPWEGLRMARELGTIFYRSRQEFDNRFAWNPTGDRHFTSTDTWEVESYLAYAGAKIIRRYDPNCYLLLSKCMDLQDLGDGYDNRISYAEGAQRIKAKCLLMGVIQDALIPMDELRTLADTINSQSSSSSSSTPSSSTPQAQFVPIDSIYGHDSFLKDFDFISQHIRNYLESGLEEQLKAEAIHNTGSNAP